MCWTLKQGWNCVKCSLPISLPPPSQESVDFILRSFHSCLCPVCSSHCYAGNHRFYHVMPLPKTLPRLLRAPRTEARAQAHHDWPETPGQHPVSLLMLSPHPGNMGLAFCSLNVPIPFLSGGFCVCWPLCLGHIFPGSYRTDSFLSFRSQHACHFSGRLLMAAQSGAALCPTSFFICVSVYECHGTNQQPRYLICILLAFAFSARMNFLDGKLLCLIHSYPH